MSTALKALLTLYILYALLKFFEFFFRDEETKKKGLYAVYVKGNGRIVHLFDNGVLIFTLILIGLLFATGIEYLSFTTGLLVGMTIIQIYFHRFSDPLPPEKSPEPPITALKMLSYSVQANPGKAWRELILMTLLFAWSLYMLATRGFGIFTRHGS
jgi:hypothetical protein